MSDAAKFLQSFVERLVSIAEERAELAEDAKAVLLEAEKAGFLKKAVSQIVKEKLLDRAKFLAHLRVWETVDQYRGELDMLDGTPLGDAADRLAKAGVKVTMKAGGTPPPAQPAPKAAKERLQ